MYLLNYFLIYSILGYLLEGTYTFIKNHHFSSGILNGPWTPIYGIGAILIILISNKIFKINANKITKIIITIILLTLTLTFLEWISGILLETFFHKTIWNYTKYKYNIGKYISLEMSVIWMIGTLIFIYIKPLIDKIEKQISLKLTIFISILFIIDLIITIIKRK